MIVAPSTLGGRGRIWGSILPLNLADEIPGEMAYAREWRCELVVPSPEVAVLG